MKKTSMMYYFYLHTWTTDKIKQSYIYKHFFRDKIAIYTQKKILMAIQIKKNQNYIVFIK